MIPPTMWREELFHPLAVHFPIVFLLTATVIYFCFLISQLHFLEKTAQLNLFLGVIAAWISIYFGQIAEEVVNRVICDPTLTHLHEDYAFYSTWIFSGILIVMMILKIAHWNQFFIQMMIFFMLCVGSIFLIYAGHLGSTLVFQQGAAVYHPSERCIEFEN